MQHLPDNYRVVKNELGQYWIQKKTWYGLWKNWKYKYYGSWMGGWMDYPEYNSAYDACQAALEELNYRLRIKSKIITVVGKC